MVDQVGWVIIGCGRVAERRIAPAVQRAQGARLVGFCSRDPARAAEYAGRHQAERAYASLDQVLNDAAVAVVYLATPNALHADQAVAAARAGRHVLCEKPLALTGDQVRRMQAEAARAGRLLGVAHQQRFHPANQRLMSLLNEGRLGRLRIVRAQSGIWYEPGNNWRLDPAISGGGVLMDLGPHVFDLMLQFGGPAARVSAFIANLHFKYDVEDFAQVRLEFERGGVGLVELSYCVRSYGGRLEAYGTGGTVVIDGSLQQAATYRSSVQLGDALSPIESTEGDCHDVFTDLIEDFTNAIRANRAPTVTAADGAATLAIIEAAYESAQSGAPVNIS